MTNRTITRADFTRLHLAGAPAEGAVAFGADLGPDTLYAAYRAGLYPFPAGTIEQQLINELTYEPDVAAGRVSLLPGAAEPYAIAWCSPDPRPLIRPGDLRIQRSLRQQLRNKVDWTTTLDACFRQVVEECRTGRSQSWLTGELVDGLVELHDRGHAHSVEVWDGTELVGGTFGVRVGAVFSADSQFTRRSGAGKVAVADLVRRFAEAGGAAVDVQHDGDHVRLMGAQPVPRSTYLELLGAPGHEHPLPDEARSARELAGEQG